MGKPAEHPAKRLRLLDQSDASADEDSVILTVNEDYARRFEHNKKREERQRLEEKYGRSTPTVANAGADTDASSSDETEDDEAVLATEGIDAQISATLQAIRAKDPRVYDTSITFFNEEDEDTASAPADYKGDKPMYLKDYHRNNLLAGRAGTIADDDDGAPPITYQQEQDTLKNTLVQEMHNAAPDSPESIASDSDDGFLVRKSKPAKNKASVPSTLDPETADRDPETFLSNFLSSRAWVPTPNASFQPFHSDDEEEDARADAFEEAYNMRFEDPATANEKLLSHARDAAAKYSVRREELNGRKKAREERRAKKEAEKLERDIEKARLKKLKIEEMEEKVQKIKEAAGLGRRSVKIEEWAGVLDEDWDDVRWEQEMKLRFGDDYYASKETEEVDEDMASSVAGKRKTAKPKWDDDIDVKDIIPEFEGDDFPPAQLTITLSSGDEVEDSNESERGAEADEMDFDEENEQQSKKKHKSKKDRLQARADAKHDARRERRIIESIADASVNTNVDLLPIPGSLAASNRKAPPRFRYRDTSPTTFGLTPLDILMADDAQLNQFAGLKKMAVFRDAERKRKDKKRLGKKARLREWRRDVFGDENGPSLDPSAMSGAEKDSPAPKTDGMERVEGKKKRKRKGKSLQAAA